jgi:hypothetical protein
MNARMAAPSSLTLSKDPRRIAWRVMIPKKTSMRFVGEPAARVLVESAVSITVSRGS